jgi:hypothetical protein
LLGNGIPARNGLSPAILIVVRLLRILERLKLHQGVASIGVSPCFELWQLFFVPKLRYSFDHLISGTSFSGSVPINLIGFLNKWQTVLFIEPVFSSRK